MTEVEITVKRDANRWSLFPWTAYGPLPYGCGVGFTKRGAIRMLRREIRKQQRNEEYHRTHPPERVRVDL
jgi:hypothetical protein